MKRIFLYLITLFFIWAPFYQVSAQESYFRSALIPDDTFYFRQWYLKKIKAEEAWNRQTPYRSGVIAIIDSGVQLDHPDLEKNIWINKGEIEGNGIDDDNNGYIDDVNGWDFVGDDNDPNPTISKDFIESEVSHGTIVAGIAAAVGDNDEGVSGVSWRAKIMPLLVLDSRGVGDASDVIKAIEYAVDNGADVINLSFVGEVYSSKLENAIRRAYNAGVLVVAAAGNNNEDDEGRNLSENPLYPVCMDGFLGENMVLGVAATDALDQKTKFSAYGDKCIDVAAPGVSVFSTSLYAPRTVNNQLVLNEYYDGYWSGTSMATPMVSGAAAMLIAKNPSLTRDELLSLLLGSSDYIEKLNPRYQSMLGSGRLNIGRAMKMGDNLLSSKKTEILCSPAGVRDSEILVFDSSGKIKRKIDVLGAFKGPVNIATGKNKNKNVIVVGAGKGGGPQVQIFSEEGNLLGQFFAYNKAFRGGVNVAMADLNNDGIDEIVTGAGEGGGPHVRIFNMQAELLGQFFAFDERFRGGVNLAIADVTADGKKDIIAGAGPGGGPQVRVFSAKGELISQFFAFAETFRGGVNVSTADFDGGLNKKAEIIVSPASKGAPHVRILNQNGSPYHDFYAYDKNYRGSVQISSGDLDNDGFDELITGAGSKGTSHVRIFEQSGTLINAFLAFEKDYLGGVNVASLKIK